MRFAVLFIWGWQVLKTVLCFGDSNTYGFIPGAENGRFAREVRWPRVMEAELGGAVEVIEEGLCGRTTVFEDAAEAGRSALQYILPCVESHEPLDLVIIMLGTNDTWERYNASAQDIGAGLEALLRALLARYQFESRRPEVLVVAPVPTKNEAGGFVINSAERAKSRMLATVFAPVAEKFGCSFFDAATVVKAPGCDNVHLDEEGHRALAFALAAETRGILGI